MESLDLVLSVFGEDCIRDDDGLVFESTDAVHRETAVIAEGSGQPKATTGEGERTHHPGKQVTEPKRLSKAFAK